MQRNGQKRIKTKRRGETTGKGFCLSIVFAKSFRHGFSPAKRSCGVIKPPLLRNAHKNANTKNEPNNRGRKKQKILTEKKTFFCGEW
jgi:hypothetical protein